MTGDYSYGRRGNSHSRGTSDTWPLRLDLGRRLPDSPSLSSVSKILVSGAAGFIGSHTVEEAVRRGHHVVAIDSFNSYYDPVLKKSNASAVARNSGVEIVAVDLAEDDFGPFLEGVSSVIHLAGQPGVQSSWLEFDSYVRNNIQVTQKLLQACLDAGVSRIVYASSSSVYGNAVSYPVSEDSPTVPFSPYGVSKLAAEHLVRAYSANFGLESVCLRYFTVYGPRQRPDMAFGRLIASCRDGVPFQMSGDGNQIRDFTYVDDVAKANCLACESPSGNFVANISGGAPASMNEVVQHVAELCGKSPNLVFRNADPGDVFRTGGSRDVAMQKLDWQPEVSLIEGLKRQVAFMSGRR